MIKDTDLTTDGFIKSLIISEDRKSTSNEVPKYMLNFVEDNASLNFCNQLELICLLPVNFKNYQYFIIIFQLYYKYMLNRVTLYGLYTHWGGRETNTALVPDLQCGACHLVSEFMSLIRAEPPGNCIRTSQSSQGDDATRSRVYQYYHYFLQ